MVLSKETVDVLFKQVQSIISNVELSLLAPRPLETEWHKFAEDDIKEARRLFNQGKTAYNTGNYTESGKLFSLSLSWALSAEEAIS